MIIIHADAVRLSLYPESAGGSADHRLCTLRCVVHVDWLDWPRSRRPPAAQQYHISVGLIPPT